MTEYKDIDDCWNRIGVWRKSDEVCPKLVTAIHCRNCDIYIETGLELLNRDIPDDYTLNNSASFNAEKEQYDDTFVSCLIFRIDTEWYALKTQILNEVGEASEIHSIPHNNNQLIKGMVNIRGEMEICISLSYLLADTSHNTTEQHHQARMVMVNLDSGKYAFRADEVLGIFKINKQNIHIPSASFTQKETLLTNRVFDYKEKHVGMIDEHSMDNKIIEGMA